MKQLFITLTLLTSLFFASCGGTTTKSDEQNATKTETKKELSPLIAEFEALVDKAVELEGKLNEEDDSVVAEYQALQTEVMTFLVDNKSAIDSLTKEEIAEFKKVMDRTTLGGE